MRSVRLLALTSALALGTTVPSSAQEPGKIGWTMGFPEAIGMKWQASDKIAIRPEFTFSGSSLDSGASASSSGWNLGFAVTALIYVHKYDQLRTYVAPRFDYGYTHTSITPSSNTLGVSPIDTSRWAAGGTFSFGAEYTLGSHFGLFGEAGASFSHSTLPSIASGPDVSGNGWGTHTAVGVIFYP
jgi:hypothetical protein